MTITCRERPKQTATLDFNKPQSTREYAIYDDTRGAADKTAILLAVAAASPAFDNGIDATTGAMITLFRGNVAIDEVGGGAWNGKVQYQTSASTIELNFTLGVQSVKIQQALEDVASYNCVSPRSAATNTAAAAAGAAAATCQADVAAMIGLAATASADAVLATVAGGVAGVNPLVTADIATVTADTATATNNAIFLSAQGQICVNATNAAANAANAGDYAGAATAAANASAASTAIATLLSAVNAAEIQVIADANQATTDAGGGNAQTLAAGVAAQQVATDVIAVLAGCEAIAADATACVAAANAAAAASAADASPGGNGVPDFQGAIGVQSDGTVEGCQIEVGAVSFSINKKWQFASLAGSYFATMADMTSRTVVNNADFSFVWMGQTLVFKKGTLRFRGASVKWTSQGEIDITYHFAYERSILGSDNFTIANSANITKEGQLYLWVRYRPSVSGNPATTVAVPLSAHVQQVYPYDDLTKLNI